MIIDENRLVIDSPYLYHRQNAEQGRLENCIKKSTNVNTNLKNVWTHLFGHLRSHT